MNIDDLPWMKLHRGDYLRVTNGWPPIARLAYLELLGCQWDRGELPIDPARLRALVPGISDDDWSEAWTLIEPMLPIDGEARRNANIAHERKRTIEMREARRRGAAKTNRKRWNVVDGGRDE